MTEGSGRIPDVSEPKLPLPHTAQQCSAPQLYPSGQVGQNGSPTPPSRLRGGGAVKPNYIGPWFSFMNRRAYRYNNAVSQCLKVSKCLLLRKSRMREKLETALLILLKVRHSDGCHTGGFSSISMECFLNIHKISCIVIIGISYPKKPLFMDFSMWYFLDYKRTTEECKPRSFKYYKALCLLYQNPLSVPTRERKKFVPDILIKKPCCSTLYGHLKF